MQAVAELVDVQVARVNDDVGIGLHGLEEQPLALDRIGQRAGLVGERVAPARAAVSAHQHVGRRIEEQDAHSVAARLQVDERRQHVARVRSATDDQRDPADARSGRGGEVGDRRDERRWEVVDDEPTEVFERHRRL